MSADLGSRPDGDRARFLDEDPADLYYEHAPCGYLSALPDGTVVQVNQTFCGWVGRPAGDVLGVRFADLLTVGGRVFTETHLVPTLRTQGVVREVALDVRRADGGTVPCLVHAVEVRDADGEPVLVRYTLFEATARRRYEADRLAAQRVAEESELRSRTLQQFVSELSAAVTTADTAAVVVHRARRAVRATAAGLWLLDRTGRRADDVRVALTAREELDDEVAAALTATAQGRADLALAAGVRSVPVGEQLAQVWPRLAAAAAAAGYTELVVVPVTADDAPLGALLVALGGQPAEDLISLREPGAHQPLGAADVDLLTTVGQQAGQALERARLHEETARQAERSAFLLDAARLLARASGVTETVERLAEMVVPQLADVCLLDLITDAGTYRVVARHGDPGRQHLVDALRSWAPPARELPYPARTALAEGRTRWFPAVSDEWLAGVVRDPAELAAVQALELAGMIAVPLAAEGRSLGVLTVSADRRRRPLTAADVELVEQLALQVALMMAKAQRYELEARTSHTLQATLLPPAPPQVPAMRVAVRYLAATSGVEIGGDFYDLAPLPGDHVAIAVGDVVGHDITAAATMGQLRSVYRALLVESPSPTAVIDRLQASWPLLGLQRMATALFATLDLPTGLLHVASAGHPPPLLVTDAGAEFLPVRPSRMLGAPPSAPVEWSGVIPPGATLVLFTDGLVESRSSDIDAGLDRLRVAAERAPTADPDELCDRLLGDLAGTHRADDIALLALTRDR
ncbi:SpoIIE family protein phosphatase [Modestobacter roseus]|uniref:Serine/threonine-protein kinase RsbW n=1 Tax=Modestobacter roseus TaxID=1181884 RepID=A0A562IS95_9ACTN|nr:SpoIIE family protein phosphatase [Modestobacter roseus]MQA32659.1 SpoIIE family protein phosphatase [Modestobacter roseus]TWH73696.1 serine/threonine-protein kinase RsbW [Modestobacter roseus]